MGEAAKSILITGGSGMLGTIMTDYLLKNGHEVAHLGRSPSTGRIKCYRWSVREKYIDPKALDGVDTIIHLAGAGIADKRWTEKRKKEILESRTLSAQLLYETLKTKPHSVRQVISAGGVNFYGLKTGDEWCAEDRTPGDDFLAMVSKEWEQSVLSISELGIRAVSFRIGIVLTEKGGLLKEVARVVKWFVGAPLASGNQWLSWIHVQDLCKMFLHAIKNEEMSGAYNAVAPNPITNRQITQYIAKAIHRPLLVPFVPEFALKLILGQMAEIAINGIRASCDKIKSTGFEFDYTDAQVAINKLIKSN